jgi:carbon-monoxide dehydrogenase medium subunit
MNEGVIDVIRIALGSVAPVPLRCLKTEDALRGELLTANTIEKAKLELAREIVPISDIRSTRNYRLKVSVNVLEDFLLKLASDWGAS